ncbi:ABC transporter permease [Mycoplasma sp. P36-A1]|uniref:ABC transporter permease n=1 Tax=Mycoplasma sp. P36-A1 TaxID=3252900 RepID=UPI003C2B61A2
MSYINNYKTSISLLGLLIIIGVLSLFVGVYEVNIIDVLKRNDSVQLEMLILSRLPRLLAIVCTGMGLSVAGLIMQKLCMNKFVSPSTGATISSAQLGILLALLFLPNSTIVSRAILAFIASLIGTLIFVWFIQKMQFKEIVMVPLVGIMFSNIVGGITSFIAFRYEMTQALATWLTGSFSLIIKDRYEIVFLVVPLLIIAFVFANHFNIVGLGKDFSKNLGVNYQVILFVGLAIAAMLTSSIVVIVGSISYIGLIVPNLVSMYKGDHLKGTLIDTALAGALFVLICDIIGRTLIAPYELPIDLIVGVLGSVIFVALLFYRLRYGNKSISIVLNERKNSKVLKLKNKEILDNEYWNITK